MRGKDKTQRLIQAGVGQHLALPVAAHLARSQLVPDPLKPYDARHLGETLEIVARALARVAPLYTQDPKDGTSRELSAAELEGAAMRRGASFLELRDGRTISNVTMKRSDLRQAIAILRAVGVPGLLPARDKEDTPARDSGRPDFLELYAQLEALVRTPEVEKANALAVRMARHAPEGRIANLAMLLMSAVNESRDVSEPLARLRAALDETAAGGDRASP